MKLWLQKRPKDPLACLFPNQFGKKISVGAVSQIVKRMATHASLAGRFASHSLRIGGATAAMRAGMTMPQIRAIGGWESKAITRYLRGIGAAKAGATQRMGF